jgi:hypothetical protein
MYIVFNIPNRDGAKVASQIEDARGRENTNLWETFCEWSG